MVRPHQPRDVGKFPSNKHPVGVVKSQPPGLFQVNRRFGMYGAQLCQPGVRKLLEIRAAALADLYDAL